MAIFHLSVKTFSRSAGQNAVAAAAYRAGAKYVDQKTGTVADYTRKQHVAASFLVCPGNVFSDPEELWNAAEAAEKRKNSTVAREYEIALPRELPPHVQEKMALEMAQRISEKYGVAAQGSIHRTDGNPHLHLLTTTRIVGPDGFGQKTRILDDRKTGAAEIVAIKSDWADLCNRELKIHNSPARVDHRSNKDRKIEALPTIHEGTSATALKKRNAYSARASENARRKEVNKLLKIAQREVLAADNAQIDAEHALSVHRETVRAEREAAANEASPKIFAYKSLKIALNEKFSDKPTNRQKTTVAQKNTAAQKKPQKTAGRVMIEKELEKLKSEAARPPFSASSLSIHGENGAAKIIDARLDKLKTEAKKTAENRRKIFKKHPILKMLGLKNRSMRDAEEAEAAAKKVYRAAKKRWSEDVRDVLSARETANRGWQKRTKPELDKKVSEIENALASPNPYVRGALNRGDLSGAIRRSQQAEREHREKIQREKIRNEMKNQPHHVASARFNEPEPGGPAPGA